jgi:ribosomal protein S18 acetylase RimI-like enzyme
MVCKWETRAAQCLPDAANWRLILAEEEGALAGFVCLNATEERDRGVLLDNLHVAQAYRRRGIARALVRLCAEIVVKEFPGESTMHLSCLETNASARALYDRLGGQLQDGIMMWDPEGGKPTPCVRYAWPAEALQSLVLGGAK